MESSNRTHGASRCAHARPATVVALSALIVLLALPAPAAAAGVTATAADAPAVTWQAPPLTDPPAGEAARGGRGALAKVGQWPYGQALGVEIDDDRHICFLGSGGAVLILNVIDPTNPILVSDTLQTRGLVVDIAYDPLMQRLVIACGLGGMEIWDVRDPTTPVQLFSDDIYYYGFALPVDNVEVSGHLAILNTSWGYLRVFDVSDPAHPALVGGDSYMGNPCHDIYLDELGQLHAVGAQRYVRYIIDPAGPIYSNGGYESLTGYAFFLIAGAGAAGAAYGWIDDFIYVIDPVDVYFPIHAAIDVGSNLSDMAYQDGLLFYTRGADRDLTIYDVTDWDHPAFVSNFVFPDLSGPRKMVLSGDYAYVAVGYEGLAVMDISDPSVPELVGSYDTLSQTVSVSLKGDYAYLPEHDDGVLIIDMTDQSAPVLAGQYDTDGYTYQTTIVDDLMYVADYYGGFEITDITVPTAPALVGTLGIDYAWRFAVEGDYAYVVDVVVNGDYWIRVVDISDPAHPSEVGSIQMTGMLWGLTADGDYLYAANWDNGLKVLDVSTPSAPAVVATFPLTRVRDVVIDHDHGYAFVTSGDWGGGLVLLDITDPLHPTEISRYYETGHFFSSVDVEGPYAYVTAPSNEEIWLLYYGDPEHPVELDRYTTPGGMSDLLARDGYLYVADGSSGLRILENQLYLSPGGGVAWEPLDSGTTENLRGVHFADQQNGFVVGDYGLFLVTDDGGDSWIPRSTGTSEDLMGVFFLNADTGWISGRNGVIRKTTDGGSSWTPQPSGTSELILDITFVGPDVGYACGGDALYNHGIALKTTNGGANWVPITPGDAPFLNSVCFLDELQGWISGDDGLVYRTVDGGAHWDSAVLPSGVTDVSFVNQDVGWACTSETAVYKSTDGGANWSFQFSQPATYSYFNSISCIDEMTGWVVGGVQLGGLSFGTTDGGYSWKEIQGAHETYLQSCCFVDAEHGWAVGHDGAILRAAPDLTSVPGESEGGSPGAWVAGPVLHPASPNPFNPKTTISYELPSDATVSLRIYNVAGRLVRTLVDGHQTAGTKSVVWDGRSDEGQALASGVYLSELVAGGEVRHGKLAMLK